MPKQLAEIDLKLIQKGRELLFSEGYSAFSMRRIAADCGIAVGTLYNYVQSKEDLLARIALQDWNRTADKIRRRIGSDMDFTCGMLVIYQEITEYRNLYTEIFSGYSVRTGVQQTLASYHPHLRREVCGFIAPLLPELPAEKREAILPVLGELILSCATHSDIDEVKLKTFLSMFCLGGNHEHL